MAAVSPNRQTHYNSRAILNCITLTYSLPVTIPVQKLNVDIKSLNKVIAVHVLEAVPQYHPCPVTIYCPTPRDMVPPQKLLTLRLSTRLLPARPWLPPARVPASRGPVPALNVTATPQARSSSPFPGARVA